MSEYLVLIYGDESAFENSDPEMFNEMMEGHATFGTNNAGALRRWQCAGDVQHGQVDPQ